VFNETDLAQSDAADAIHSKMETLKEKIAQVETVGAAHRKALESTLAEEKELQKLELSYLRLADGLIFDIDQVSALCCGIQLV